MKIINTNECEHCEYGEINDKNKARIIVHCKARNKNYSYGQCVPCEDKKVKRKDK